jgi:hypothetical protein
VTNSAQTTRISANSSRLLRSTALSTRAATPLRTHVSLSASRGRPSRPAGRSIAVGAPEAPAVMSTSSPVAAAIRCAAWRMRSRLTASMPVTPSTRTRTAEMPRLGSIPAKR